MAFLLLQPCFTFPLWSWWKTSQVYRHVLIEDELLMSHSCVEASVWPDFLTFVRRPVHVALKRVELEECVKWMVPFAVALRELGGSPMKTFTGIPADDMHNIQSHASYITWLVRKNEAFLASVSDPVRSEEKSLCSALLNLWKNRSRSAVYKTTSSTGHTRLFEVDSETGRSANHHD